MFNNTKFFIFANKAGLLSTEVPTGTALTLYRDFINDPQLNGPESEYRIGPNLNFIRNSYGTFFNSLCTIETVGVNIPRFSYTPQGEYKGLLIERSSTNFVPYSTDFAHSSWSKPLTSDSGNFGVSLTSNVPGVSAPDGTETVTYLANTSAFGYHVVSWGELPVPPNFEIELSYYCDRSIFVKRGTARYLCVSVSPAPSAESTTSIYDFDQNAFISESTLNCYSLPIKDDWYRIGFNRLTTNSNTNRLTIGIAKGSDWNDAKFETSENEISGVYIWGAQAEIGLYPTSYIPTSGAEVTRAADNITISGRNFTTFYSPTASTFFIHGTKNYLLDYENFKTGVFNLSSPNWSEFETPIYRQLLFDNNLPLNALATFTNNISSKYWSVGALLSSDRYSLLNTGMSSSIDADTTANLNVSASVGLLENNIAFYQNQTLVGIENNAALPLPPVGVVQLQLGRFMNFKYFDGYIQKFGYHPARLNNEQLSAL